MRTICLALFAIIISSNASYAQDTEEIIINESDYKKSFEVFDKGLIAFGDYKDSLAIAYMSQAIELNNGNADFFLGRAQTYSLLGELEKAEKDILSAIALAANQFDIHYNAGNIYFKKKEITESIRHYTLALEYNDHSPETMSKLSNCIYNRGNSYLQIKKYEEAEEDFTQSINLNPEFTNAIHNRGIARKNLNKKEDACMDFSMAESLGSNISANYVSNFCN